MMRSSMPQQINQGIGTLNERARGMYRGPRGIEGFAQYMQAGGEAVSLNRPAPATGMMTQDLYERRQPRFFTEYEDEYFDNAPLGYVAYEGGAPVPGFEDRVNPAPRIEAQLGEMRSELGIPPRRRSNEFGLPPERSGTSNEANVLDLIQIYDQLQRRPADSLTQRERDLMSEIELYLSRTTGMAEGGEVRPTEFMSNTGVGRAPGQGSTTGMPQSGPARDVYTGPSGERLNAVRERVMASSGVDPVQIAAEEGVDPNLFLNLIAQESGGRANAESEAGAYGFTQLMDATARELGVDRTDPVQNLRGGARYLRQQIETFQDIPLALAAYNAGPGAVRRFGGIPPYAETRKYIANILGLPGGGQAVSPTMRPSPVVPVPRPAEQDRGFVGMVPQRNPLNELGELLVSRPAPQIAADQAARLTEQLETGTVAPNLAGFTGLMRSMP